MIKYLLLKKKILVFKSSISIMGFLEFFKHTKNIGKIIGSEG
jgi:hypothetical protein